MFQAQLFVPFFGPAQVGHQHGFSAVVQDFENGGFGAANPCRVGNNAVFVQGNIKIHTYQSGFPFEIKIINGFHNCIVH